MHLARSRVTRSLTDKECQRFLHVEECPPTPLTERHTNLEEQEATCAIRAGGFLSYQGRSRTLLWLDRQIQRPRRRIWRSVGSERATFAAMLFSLPKELKQRNFVDLHNVL